jgi:hypothetical protein
MIVRNIHGIVKGERWIIITNKKTEDILQREDSVKFIKSLRLMLYGYTERTQNKEYQKQLQQL